MDYVGESLLPGRLGNFFIAMSLIASFIATIGYFLNTRADVHSRDTKWLRIARIAFLVEFFSVLCSFGILFYIISNHLFEYKYAWQHSSRTLETKYLFACFWEGQEGSFLLWSFWHCVIGLVLMKRAKSNWESPVMTVISFAQFCLASMIAGLYVFGQKIGSNPFVLLRNELEAPLFSKPDYLLFIKDGNDLNPLLQNYWMVIHPPILFLGFASVIVPFAYATAGLWTKRYSEWIRPALPWALFSAAIFGAGIMMGAMWAYESLTFGGYWAWDPVENASLVPWLILVAGIHTMIIQKHTGRSLRASSVFIILSFLLVLYSTFLTRSGILGDSSVHAFTDLGMNVQLFAFLFAFVLPVSALLILRYRKIPHIRKEEETLSREFWMFIGSLVLLISAASIIGLTSIPVVNKIAGFFTNHDTALFKPLAIGENSEYSYNRIQILVAIGIGLLTGITQYLKYRKTDANYFLKKMALPAVVSVFLGILLVLVGNVDYDRHGTGYLILIWIAIVSSVYAVMANLLYIRIGLKGKLRSAGASIAHVGFGLMLLGILISASKKEILSFNRTGIFMPMGEGSAENPGENLTLLKGVRTDMGKYWVTYLKDSAKIDKPLWYYDIKFENKATNEQFTLKPNSFINYKGVEGLLSNPDAKHFWNHDVFAYITSVPDPATNIDTSKYVIREMKRGDEFDYGNGVVSFEKLLTTSNITVAGLAADDTASIATLKIRTKSSREYDAEPILIRKNNQSFPLADSVKEEKLVFQLRKVNGDKIELGVKQSNEMLEYVTIKAYNYPFINLLWIGTLITFIGFIVSVYNRIKMRRIYN